MLAAALFVLAALLALLALLWALQRRLIYLPFPAAMPPAATLLAGAREVTLQTVDGIELGAWFLPAGGMSVLVAPGNAGNRSLRAPLAAALARHGLGVLLFDYRGYGGNRGRPTEAGLARDVRAALRFLAADAGLPRERLLYYGESLGAGVVAELATEYPPGRSPSHGRSRCRAWTGSSSARGSCLRAVPSTRPPVLSCAHRSPTSRR